MLLLYLGARFCEETKLAKRPTLHYLRKNTVIRLTCSNYLQWVELLLLFIVN